MRPELPTMVKFQMAQGRARRSARAVVSQRAHYYARGARGATRPTTRLRAKGFVVSFTSRAGEAATGRCFPTGRHVCQFQSADVSAHSKIALHIFYKPLTRA
jgi:hypothetical protein